MTTWRREEKRWRSEEEKRETEEKERKGFLLFGGGSCLLSVGMEGAREESRSRKEGR
jgi:hypothetical protein